MAGEDSSGANRKTAHVVVSEKLKERLQALARSKGTSIGYQVENLLEEPLAKAEAQGPVARAAG